MASPRSEPTEHTHLLSVRSLRDSARLSSPSPRDIEARSLASSFVSKEEELLGNTAVGEILPYNDYSSIDFLHDLVSPCLLANYLIQVLTSFLPSGKGCF
jgi:chloride channel 3/4/5